MPVPLQNSPSLLAEGLLLTGDKSSSSFTTHQTLSTNSPQPLFSKLTLKDYASAKFEIEQNITVRPFQPRPFQTPQQLKSWPLQLPEDNPHFVEREALTTELDKHLQQTTQPVVLCALHGLGGVGKTQLALHHLHHANPPYAFRGWFDAGDKDRLLTQYRSLALEVGLLAEEELNNLDAIKGHVKRWFNEHKDWLLIFDNAPNYETIQSFLPKQGRDGKIVITSRASRWEETNCVMSIPVDVMTETEAIALFKKLSGCEAPIEAIQTVVGKNYLGRLPLAVAQAAAYLRQQNRLTSYTVNDYLKH